MTSITAKIKEPYADAKHVLVTVFAGPDEEHRASCGVLHCRWEEAEEIERRLADHKPESMPPDVEEALEDLMNTPMDILEMALASLSPTKRMMLRRMLERQP